MLLLLSGQYEYDSNSLSMADSGLAYTECFGSERDGLTEGYNKFSLREKIFVRYPQILEPILLILEL